ncbi:phosphotransferase [Thioalkalivibrio sp.]|uniref:phosphotransferase n=1 Tax=Thioalkalivibrio sp. TaxID=2093813 RepID=UPI0025EA7051|nr:phosphotransferase [Thioalkalivibrio sp.]
MRPDSTVILNYHGRLSLRTKAGGHTFKIAECESLERALLAEQALKSAYAQGGPVPRFIARTGAVIACEWVEGRSCKSLPALQQVEAVLECQVALWNRTAPDLPGPPRYVHLESLLARFARIGPRTLPATTVQGIVDRLRARLPDAVDVHLIHPDLTPVNIVMTEDGPVIIDNEVISIGAGCEFDVWNSGEALFGFRNSSAIKEYVEAFHRKCPMPSLFSHQPVWDDFRMLRKGLKSLTKGRRLKARRLFRKLEPREDLASEHCVHRGYRMHCPGRRPDAERLFQAVVDGTFVEKMVFKSDGQTYSGLIEIEGQTCVLKIPRGRNRRLSQRLMSFFRPSVAVRQMQSMVQLAQLGLRTPEPVCAGERRAMGILTDSFLLYEYAEGRTATRDDAALLTPELLRLHELGYTRNDPHAKNYLIDERGVVFIDTILRRPRLFRTLRLSRGLIRFTSSSPMALEHIPDRITSSWAYRLARVFTGVTQWWKHRRRGLRLRLKQRGVGGSRRER